MFRWLRKAPTPVEHLRTLQEQHNLAVKTINELNKKLAQLQDDHDALHAAFVSFRGRVYAWRGKIELAPPEDEPAQKRVNLADPKLSKAELRAHLGITTPAGAAAFMRGDKSRHQ